MDADSANSKAVPVVDSAQRPAQITLAVLALWLSLALGVAGSILDRSHLSTLASPAFILSVQGITFGILALLTYMIGLGRNWARIVYAVLFAIGLVQLPVLLCQTYSRSMISGAIVTAQILIQATVLALVFVGPGRSWFRRRA